jgi:DNA repair exonuclease SbcCD ATPase subunit
MTTIPTTILNKNATITHIVHISDIHCKRDKQDHHRLVFDKFYKNLKEHSNEYKKNLLVVICGDLFDSLSCETILLAKEFCINLCEIVPVCIIPGNHCISSRNNPDTLDYVATTLSDLKTNYPLHIINKTGNYIYGNVVFGATSLFDQTVVKIDPKHNDKIKIALYHGIIHGTKNNLGYALSNSSTFNQTDFKEFDFTFLGDVHQFQYLNAQKTMAYPSSLLQLNHGESIENHGYILWDIINKTSKHVHIPNNYGYLTIKVENNKTTNYDMNTKTSLPKYIDLKIIQKNSNDKIVEEIHEKIDKKTNIIKYHVEKIETNCNDIVLLDNNKSLMSIKNDNDAKELLFNYITEHVKPNQDELTQMHNIVDELLIKAENKYTTEEKHIAIKSLEFSNCLSYGPDNSINFGKFENIINLTGQNGSGKSSIIHCLLFAIYGMDQDGNAKYDYMNSRKNDFKTRIILDVNGTEYKIERNGKYNGKNRTNFQQNVYLYKNNRNINEKKTVEIEQQIRDEICDINQLLNLCIMTQKNSISFFDMSDEEKKKYICQVFKLDIYNNIVKYARTLNGSLTTQIEEKNKLIYTDQKNRIETKDTALQTQKNKINKKYEKLNKKILKNKNESDKLNKKKIEYELKYNKIKKNIPKEKPKETKEDVERILNENKKKLEKYENMEEKNKNFIDNKTKRINEKDDEIKILLKNYNSSVEIIDNKNIEEEKNRISNQLNDNNGKLNSLINKNKDYNDKINNNLKQKFSKDLEKKYNEYLNYINQNNAIKNEKTNKQNLLKQQENYLETLKNHRYNINCNECMSNSATKEKRDIEQKIKTLNNEIKILKTDEQKLNGEINNYKKYDDENTAKKSIMDKNMEYNNEITNNKNTINLLKKTIENNVMQLGNINDQENKYNNNMETINQNKIIDDKIKELENQKDKIREEKNTEYDEYNQIIATIDKYKKIKKIIKNNEVKNKLDAITREYNKLIDESRKLNEERDNINTNLGQITNELNSIVKTIEEKQTLTNKKKINEKIMKIIDEGFVNKLLSDKILPKIENSLNNLLKPYVNFNIRLKNINTQKISAYKDDDGFRSLVSKLSGYQSVITAVAFRLVMNQLNMQTKSKFIILDEIFSYTDNTNILLTPQLFDFMKRYYDWILIITHNDQIKGFTDRDIKVCIENGDSKIVV